MLNPNLVFCTELASAFADIGMRHVCMSPGSRNTPLIAGFAAEERVAKWPILDERSAGFFAVGLARTTMSPVALVCTSGTAAAEYHPAVVEASQSDVPLIVLTADRPPELRGVGAPQTIDQIDLFGSSPRLFIDARPPDESAGGGAAEIAHEAWTAATGMRPGPVHVNLPFREPLLTGEPATSPGAVSGTVAGPFSVPDLSEVGARIEGRNGLIIAGRSNDPAFPSACADLAKATGFPIIADPLSGLRYGEHSLEYVLGAGDALAAAGVLDRIHPDALIRFGPIPTSKPVWQWMQAHPEVEQVLIDTANRDATRSATALLTAPATSTARALTAAVSRTARPSWADAWLELDAAAGKTIADFASASAFPNEPSIARTLIESAPSESVITVGSSMPIRDVDTFGGKAGRTLRLFGNRGTNGIDGLVSATIGSAASGGVAVSLVGDVAMFHDLNSLGTAAQLDLNVTVVVINNTGGGIFHLLPQRDPAILAPETFERFLATPHNTDFVAVAAALGMEAHETSARIELGDLIANPSGRPRLIQLRTDRVANAQLHRAAFDAVRTALAEHLDR
jgi:2-succinyl-5-enolpyruvyl-6-hydroxy-3-cyclohexene-1-carboxylate synthase